MQQIPMPIANLYQTQLEASRRFADAFFAGTEKLDRLMLEATHRAVSDQLRLAQAAAGGSEASGTSFADALLQRTSDGGVNYQAEIISVLAEMQTEMGKSMQQYIEDISVQTAGIPSRVSEAAQPATAAAPDMANPMTNMFSMWESAFREATAMATRGMSAAGENMGRAAENANAYTRSATRAAENVTESVADRVKKGASEAAETSTRRHK